MFARLDNILKTKKIGIVIHANPNLFTNGITQNAFFIYKCYTDLGFTCELLCQEGNSKPLETMNVPITYMCNDPTVFDCSQFHTVISVSRRFTKENRELLRKNGVRSICFICGSEYTEDIRSFLYGNGSGSTLSAAIADAVWTISSDEYSLEYFRLVSRSPVFIMPHVWSPILLKDMAKLYYKKEIEDLNYKIKPSNAKMDVLIAEPNLCNVKTAWLPLMICEYFDTHWPGIINNVFVFNVPEHSRAYEMVSRLTIDSKVRKFKRQELANILTHFNTQPTAPVFLSHHTLNSLNYLYYELLHFGFPLVHNSSDLSGSGYTYQHHDIKGGAEALLKAFQSHNTMFEEYQTNAKNFLNCIDPMNSEVQKICKKLITNSLLRTNPEYPLV